QAADKAVDITGTWDLAVETPSGTGNPVLEIKQEGADLSGTYSGAFGTAPLKGKIKGEKFEIKFNSGGIDMTYKGKSDGATMKGSVDLGQYGMGSFSGNKK
ncbi:MAG: hypothetical protein HZB87_08685, partial [Desulfatitalea sp.]|nr:hypothetical protein [Desulfatitalea sp.]